MNIVYAYAIWLVITLGWSAIKKEDSEKLTKRLIFTFIFYTIIMWALGAFK